MPLDGVNDLRPPRPKLILQVEGAREGELARGVAAAEAVLYRGGDIDLVAAMAANASWDFIMFDGDGQPIDDIPEEEHRLATLWEHSLGRRSMRVASAGPNSLQGVFGWASIRAATHSGPSMRDRRLRRSNSRTSCQSATADHKNQDFRVYRRI
jgi:hypothetical protein